MQKGHFYQHNSTEIVWLAPLCSLPLVYLCSLSDRLSRERPAPLFTPTPSDCVSLSPPLPITLLLTILPWLHFQPLQCAFWQAEIRGDMSKASLSIRSYFLKCWSTLPVCCSKNLRLDTVSPMYPAGEDSQTGHCRVLCIPDQTATCKKLHTGHLEYYASTYLKEKLIVM